MMQSSSMDMYETTVDNTLIYKIWYFGISIYDVVKQYDMYETTVDNAMIYNIWYKEYMIQTSSMICMKLQQKIH